MGLIASDEHLLITATVDLRQAAIDWAGYLSHERRLAKNTLEAYQRDLEQFLRFLTMHLGGPPSLAEMAVLTLADVRAFLAYRRTDGAGAKTLGRQIAAFRSFGRYCERHGIAVTTAFAAIRPPKQPRSLPKALSVADSARLMDTVEALSEEPWIAARDRAVLMLLYGCGLRISEAVGLKRADMPTGERETIRVTGKGGRERVVPVLPVVQAAVESYFRLARSTCRRRSRCSAAPAAALCRLESSSLRSPGSAAPWDWRKPPRRTHSGIPLPRTSWEPAAISAPSRSCWGMPASRRHRSTPMSMSPRLLEVYRSAHPRARGG
jgi:site-specific recombinase XerD